MPPLDDKQQASLNALLFDAVESRNLERVKLCLSHGAQTGKTNMKEYFEKRNEAAVPLAHFAYKFYDRAIFETLVKADLPLEEKDSGGYTALARAVEYQRADVVENMLALGASPLAVNSNDKTILDLARENGMFRPDSREKIIDALLKALPPAGDPFAAAAKKAETSARDVSTSEDLVVGKPISLAPHKKKEGFQL